MTTLQNKLVIASGTGFLGKLLVDYYKNKFTELIILTRGTSKTEGNVRFVNWDAKNLGTWSEELKGADVVINLAGKNVDCRYTEKNKEAILQSRLQATTVLGKAILQCKKPPALWINSASATIYEHEELVPHDEHSTKLGQDFSANVCKAWEKTFFDCETLHTRKIALRIGLVLHPNGSVLPVLMKIARFGLGGKMGKGTQYINWVASNDFIGMVDWVICTPTTQGVYNCTSPQPEQNKHFMFLLRKAMNILIGLPATEWMIKLGTCALRTEAELVLKSRYVMPMKSMQEGYVFKQPNLNQYFNFIFKQQ